MLERSSYTKSMAKNPKSPRGANQLAKSIVDLTTGETEEPSFQRSSVGTHTVHYLYNHMHSHAEHGNELNPPVGVPLVGTQVLWLPQIIRLPQTRATTRDCPYGWISLVPTILRGNPYRMWFIQQYAFPRGTWERVKSSRRGAPCGYLNVVVATNYSVTPNQGNHKGLPLRWWMRKMHYAWINKANQ